jgi:hypothetical protein
MTIVKHLLPLDALSNQQVVKDVKPLIELSETLQTLSKCACQEKN